MEELVDWLDSFPLSRLKKNLSRDFSDGVLVAEILKQHHPNIVELHNYQSTSASASKFINWKTLNGMILVTQRKCLKSWIFRLLKMILKLL